CDAGSARPRHAAHPQQLRDQRQARQPDRRGDGKSARAHRAGQGLRRDRRLRCRHRSGVRADPGEAGGLETDRRGHETGCGAVLEQIGKVMIDSAYPPGPFAVSDLSGLDIGYDTRKRRAEQYPNYRKLPIADRIVEAGRLGQKNGKGWYRYEPGDRTPHPDPEVARIVKETTAELGVPQREFSDDEILKRLLFASVNEACKILDEGKALRASDIDVMW